MVAIYETKLMFGTVTIIMRGMVMRYYLCPLACKSGENAGIYVLHMWYLCLAYVVFISCIWKRIYFHMNRESQKYRLQFLQHHP